MGGRVDQELTSSISHLVVKEVGSNKYYGASRHKIPIMTVEWIEHLWEKGIDKLVVLFIYLNFYRLFILYRKYIKS